MKFSTILFLVCSFGQSIFSQKNEDLIQFSGTILTAGRDSLTPIPYVLVRNKSRQSGAVSNLDGFFSLVVERGDSLEFSSLGFKKSTLIVPENIKNNKFFASHIMMRESNALPEIIIVPWKNVDELKKAFVDLDLNEDDIARAYQNIQLEKWAEMSKTVAYDGSEMRNYTLNNQNQQMQMRNGLQPANNLINPFAWMQFIDYLKKVKKTKRFSETDGRFEDTGK